ncbi:unnamed protein product [Sphagnum troendelagicum]|uniref:Uncharacterized protein n=1 Tax=Sphagnum troendelagicum TaxID=128251 RepID=A0ABP0UGV7_9BRYO
MISAVVPLLNQPAQVYRGVPTTTCSYLFSSFLLLSGSVLISLLRDLLRFPFPSCFFFYLLLKPQLKSSPPDLGFSSDHPLGIYRDFLSSCSCFFYSFLNASGPRRPVL